jgi:8-oxo-dGTP diphosphatase
VLRVAAAAVVARRRLLVVSKRAAPGIFYLPGGKPERGESMLACLRRELREELGVRPRSARLFLEIRAPAALEGVPMHMSVFLTELDGTPAPAGELHALAWWPDEPSLTLAPAVGDHLLPALRAAGLV